MKSATIAAVVAAATLGAFADAQVYDWTLNVKTTEAKIGTVKASCEMCDGATSYRKQTSLKISGIYWGCLCSEFVGITGPVSENEGIFFWNGTKKAAFYDQEAGEYIQPEFGWEIINRIGQKADDVEGVWKLTLGDFELMGAGFGKAKGCDEATYVTSLSGNFAGTFIAGNGCKRCEEATGSAWLLCDCGEADSRTAAYGTWTMKYNSSKTKKFAESSDWSWNKWDGDVLEAIQATIDPVVPPTPVDDKLAENYKKAVQAVNVANQAVVTTLGEYRAAQQYRQQVVNSDYADCVAEWGDDGLTIKTRAVDIAAESAGTIRDTYEESIKKSGKGYADAFADVLKAGDQEQGVTFNGDDWATSLLNKYAAAYEAALDNYASALKNSKLADAQFAARIISAADQKTAADNLDAAKKVVVTAKADIVQAIADYKDKGNDTVLAAKYKTVCTSYLTAFTTYKEELSALDADTYAASEMWENAWKYDENGKELTTTEQKAIQDQAKADFTAAGDAWVEANKTLTEAEKALQTAETACLVATGSKDCQ